MMRSIFSVRRIPGAQIRLFRICYLRMRCLDSCIVYYHHVMLAYYCNDQSIAWCESWIPAWPGEYAERYLGQGGPYFQCILLASCGCLRKFGLRDLSAGYPASLRTQTNVTSRLRHLHHQTQWPPSFPLSPPQMLFYPRMRSGRSTIVGLQSTPFR